MKFEFVQMKKNATVRLKKIDFSCMEIEISGNIFKNQAKIMEILQDVQNTKKKLARTC